MTRVSVRAALVLAAAISSQRPAHGAELESASAASAKPAPDARPLAPLPKPPPLDLPAPDRASSEALDDLLSRVASKDASVRETAAQEILETERDALPAIHQRLARIADSSDHRDMKDLLGSIRDKARGAREAAPSDGDRSAPDYLEMLLEHPRPDSKVYKDLVSVVAMSRMLRQIGTVGACRELIGIHARFGEFLRVDTQRQLAALGERAVAALIEGTRHPAPKIAQWSTKQLDALGKSLSSEAVQTTDPAVLSDVLRAYGRVRDPDAARLVISFANSERAQIREAARQAVVLMGEVANWQLRDTYENVVGRKPPREFSWDRTARELFAEFDKLRLSQVHAIFEKGLAAFRAGKLDDMSSAFDEVLAQSPVFERGTEMVPGYLAYARAHLDDSPDKALIALRRAERLSADDSAERKQAESARLTLEAEELFARHVADPVLAHRAIELDPGNTRARELGDRIAGENRDAEGRSRRYLGAAAIAVAALGSILVILLRKRADGPRPEQPTEANDD